MKTLHKQIRHHLVYRLRAFIRGLFEPSKLVYGMGLRRERPLLLPTRSPCMHPHRGYGRPEGSYNFSFSVYLHYWSLILRRCREPPPQRNLQQAYTYGTTVVLEGMGVSGGCIHRGRVGSNKDLSLKKVQGVRLRPGRHQRSCVLLPLLSLQSICHFHTADYGDFI